MEDNMAVMAMTVVEVDLVASEALVTNCVVEEIVGREINETESPP
jgi:hypothetical protein